VLLASRHEFEDDRTYRTRYAELRREIVARGDESRPVLEVKLASVDAPARVRRASANLLGAIRSDASLPLLAGVLREDPDDEVRRLAARAIGNYWDSPRARQILVDELVHGEPFDGSYAVVFSLSEFGDPADIALFEDLAANDEDVSVRTQAVHALGRFDDPALIPFLESVAQNDPHPDPRGMAAEVLADLHR
jgi:HEAT repeat protein